MKENNMYNNNNEIYVDNAATSPVLDDVLEAMKPYYQMEYGNPSSIHDKGIKAKKAVEESREQIASCLKCYPDEIVFTSGGTESNNLAVFGTAIVSNGKPLVISSIEHHSILNAANSLQRYCREIRYADVKPDGEIDLGKLCELVDTSTALVAVMCANNETGVIQPVEKISEIAHNNGVPYFSDAVQAIGNVEVDLSRGIFDLLSFSGHKIGAPKGIGALYINRKANIAPLIYGGGQEYGVRAGTENVPAIVGLSVALNHAVLHSKNKRYVRELKKVIVNTLSSIPGAYISGREENTLPGTIHVCFDGVDGSDLVRYMNRFGVFASSSSACTSTSIEPSHVLLSMRVPYELARGSLRISINETNTQQEIEYLAEILPNAVSTIRSMAI